MHSISSRIVSFVTKSSTIEIEQKDWCVYALEKRLYRVLSFLLVILLGCCLRMPVESALAFLSINFLRTRISGWHAKNPIVCILLTVIISCGIGFIANAVMLFYVSTYCALLLTNGLLFCFYKPVNNPHLHLTAEELEKSKHLATIRIGGLTALSAILLFFSSMALFSICMQIGCFISLLSTFFDERRY